MRNSYLHNFEDVYLKTSILKKATGTSDIKKLESFKKDIDKIAYYYFNKNYYEISKISIELDDVKSIALFHAHVFLSLYDNIEGEEKYSHLSRVDIDKQQRGNMLNFITQRLNNMSKVFSKKLKNILGEESVTYYYKKISPNFRIPEDELYIVYSPETYGFKKVRLTEYLNNKDSTEYIQIGVSHRQMMSLDYYNSDLVEEGEEGMGASFFSANSIYGYDSSGEVEINPYTSSPEEFLIKTELTDHRDVVLVDELRFS